MNDMCGIIFAYKSNPELKELVKHRTTASLPYGGRYRIIDFTLSSMINAGITDIGVIMRDSYQSLLDHVGSGKDWDLSRTRGGLKLLPPFAYNRKYGLGDFRGRMEALSGVYSYLERIRQQYVVLASGDIVASLPLTDVLAAHIESGADITAVCTKKPIGNPPESIYFSVDERGFVREIIYNPHKAQPLESLEVYILSKKLLIEQVEYCSTHSLYKFGRDVLQRAVADKKIFTFVFDGFAASMYSAGAYYKKSMELLRPAARRSLFVPGCPIRTKERSDVSTYYGPESEVKNCLVADGCRIEGKVYNSILFRGVHIEKGACVSNCIIMQDSVIHSRTDLNYIIADKEVVVSSDSSLIGHEAYPMTISKGSVI